DGIIAPRKGGSMTGIEFGVGFGGAGGAQPLIEDVYRICVMGDFGGQATGRLVEVDRDNIDQIMAAMKVPAAGLELRGLDDFHPDHLLTRIVVPAETEPPAPPIKPPSVLAPGGLLDAIVGEESLRQAAKSEAE